MFYDEIVKEAYEEIIGFSKEAAPKWRKEWGNLSEKAQNRLRSSIASQSAETAKRIRGGQAVAKKFGVDRVIANKENPVDLDFADRAKSKPSKWVVSKLQKYLGNKIGPATLIDYNTGYTKVVDHFSEGKDGKPNFDGLKTVSKFGKKNLKKMYYKNRPLYDEIRSIINDAHEMGGESVVYKAPSKKIALMFSHLSPEVLHRESASVATASPEAKKFMQNMRSKKHFAGLVPGMQGQKGIKPWRRISEIDALKKGGLEYAKDAVVNKSRLKSDIDRYANLTGF